jgi:hypothetical protein
MLPDISTKESWAARASNLLGAVTKGSPVSAATCHNMLQHIATKTFLTQAGSRSSGYHPQFHNTAVERAMSVSRSSRPGVPHKRRHCRAQQQQQPSSSMASVPQQQQAIHIPPHYAAASTCCLSAEPPRDAAAFSHTQTDSGRISEGAASPGQPRPRHSRPLCSVLCLQQYHPEPAGTMLAGMHAPWLDHTQPVTKQT